MDIYKTERFLNSLDDTIIEKRINIFTNVETIFGIVILFDGISYSEVGSIDLQSKDVHSAVNEWRLKQPEIVLKLAPKIASIRKKQKFEEKERKPKVIKKPWYKRLFVK